MIVVPSFVRVGIAGGFLRRGGGAGAGLRDREPGELGRDAALCSEDSLSADDTDMGESGRFWSAAGGPVGENGDETTTISGGSCVRGDVGSIMAIEFEGSPASSDPARSFSRLRDRLAGTEVAAATLGRLIELSLLPIRTASRSRSFVGAVTVERRFSTLLLVFSDFGLLASDTASKALLALACTPIGEPMPAIASGTELRSESVLLTLCVPKESEVAWRGGLILRNWTHQSPERQRSTRRFVVGSTSRIFSCSMSDSRTCTICARL